MTDQTDEQPVSVPALGTLRAFVAAAARRQIGVDPEQLFDSEILHDLGYLSAPDAPISADTVVDDDGAGRPFAIADLFEPSTWGFDGDRPQRRQPDDLIGKIDPYPIGNELQVRLFPIFAPQASVLCATVRLRPDGSPQDVEFELD